MRPRTESAGKGLLQTRSPIVLGFDRKLSWKTSLRAASSKGFIVCVPRVGPVSLIGPHVAYVSGEGYGLGTGASNELSHGGPDSDSEILLLVPEGVAGTKRFLVGHFALRSRTLTSTFVDER